MTYNELWKPQPGDGIANKQVKHKARKKRRKEKNKSKRKTDSARQQRERIRADLLKHFELNAYVANLAICNHIHERTGAPLPTNDRQVIIIMADYWNNNIQIRGSYGNIT